MRRARCVAILGRLDEWVCALLLLTIVVLLSVNVTLRYLFFTALPWCDELVEFSFVWFVYLSMVVAVRRARHFRVEALVQRLPADFRTMVYRLADVVWLIFNLVVVVQGVILVQALRRFPNVSPMLGWSMAYVYLVIPLAFGLASAWILVALVRDWRAGASPGRRAA